MVSSTTEDIGQHYWIPLFQLLCQILQVRVYSWKTNSIPLSSNSKRLPTGYPYQEFPYCPGKPPNNMPILWLKTEIWSTSNHIIYTKTTLILEKSSLSIKDKIENYEICKYITFSRGQSISYGIQLWFTERLKHMTSFFSFLSIYIWLARQYPKILLVILMNESRNQVNFNTKLVEIPG